MSYDIKCDEIARAFLADHPSVIGTEEHVKRLAQSVQDRIEDVIEDMRAEYEEKVRHDDESQGSVR